MTARRFVLQPWPSGGYTFVHNDGANVVLVTRSGGTAAAPWTVRTMPRHLWDLLLRDATRPSDFSWERLVGSWRTRGEAIAAALALIPVAHRYDSSEDRCVCGAEVVYFDADGTYGCDVGGPIFDAEGEPVDARLRSRLPAGWHDYDSDWTGGRPDLADGAA